LDNKKLDNIRMHGTSVKTAKRSVYRICCQRSLVPLYIGLIPGYFHEITTRNRSFTFQANFTVFTAGIRQ